MKSKQNTKNKTAKKKTAGKKGANKKQNKPMEVTIEKKVYGEVPEKFHFFLNDGKKLKNIYELIEALDQMSDEVFYYHVNEDRNDFANWIKEVMTEEKLAKDLEKVEDKIEAQMKLLKHVVKNIAKKSAK